jgi:hypothetical protein
MLLDVEKRATIGYHLCFSFTEHKHTRPGSRHVSQCTQNPGHPKLRVWRARAKRKVRENLGGNMRDDEGVLIVAQPVSDYLHEGGSRPIIERNIKRVLRVICSLVHFCDSHDSMYNGVPPCICAHGFGCPPHYHRPITNGHHHYGDNPHDLGTYMPPASLTDTP